MAEYLITFDEWQRAEIEAGLAEAKKGVFASDAEVKRVFGKFKMINTPTISPSPRRFRGEAGSEADG
jgi:predicted transcriptional regulator